MKKIGLVGGIGPESTIMYYRGIVHGVGQVMGSEHLPRLAIDSLSAFEVFSLFKSRRFDDLEAYVLGAVNNLAASGAELAALTGNTPHVVFDRVRDKSPIPLISAIEATRDAALERGLNKIGLLGTVFTMTNDFFKAPFEEAGIQVVVPSADEIAYVQNKIEAELEHGIVKDQTRRDFVALIDDIKQREGIQQIVLGCTELPLLLNDELSPVPCLNTADIHIRAIVQAMTCHN